MTEEFDTSWFDLKNYEALKTMSIEDWQKVLGERYEFHGHVDSCRRGFYEVFYEQEFYFKCDFLDSSIPPEELYKKITSLLKQGVITNFGLGSYPLLRPLNNLMALGSSVNNLTVHDVVEMSNDHRLHYEVDTHNGKKKFQKDQKHWQEMLSKPFDDGHDGSAKVKIDLYATDEKLKKDFDQWLKHIRQATGYYDHIPKKRSKKMVSNKELYTQKDFDKWIQFGVIPYLDLVLIAEIECKKITQNKLAHLIFPNEKDVDIVERLRQVTKPEAEQLIKNKVHKTLLAQLAY